MRLFRRIKDPVEGTAQVAGCTVHTGEATWESIRMNLVVEAPGVEPFTLEHNCLARADKWPYPGETLPVVFDRQHHDRLDVQWDKLPSKKELARQRAEALRDAMADGGSTAVRVEVQGAPDDDAERIAALERLVRLRDGGALTQAEFETEKRRLLD